MMATFRNNTPRSVRVGLDVGKPAVRRAFKLDGSDAYGCIRRMKMKLLACLMTTVVAFLGSGCYSTVEGKKKAGVAMSTDHVEGRYERKPAEVFSAAKYVLGYMGTLTSENTIVNTLQARVDNNTVYVKVDEVEPGISRVMVQARKSSMAGNIALASEVDKQIALQLMAR
jgi:hypothetical protein